VPHTNGRASFSAIKDRAAHDPECRDQVLQLLQRGLCIELGGLAGLVGQQLAGVHAECRTQLAQILLGQLPVAAL
jgi:hypothetical protein